MHKKGPSFAFLQKKGQIVTARCFFTIKGKDYITLCCRCCFNFFNRSNKIYEVTKTIKTCLHHSKIRILSFGSGEQDTLPPKKKCLVRLDLYGVKWL